MTANTRKSGFDYLPLSIRVETAGGVATPLVLRGTPLPAKRSDTFSPAAENQSSVEISLWIGESPLTRNNVKLGSFHLKGIPPTSAGKPQLTVEFSVDRDCAVTARAMLQGTELQVEKGFPPPQDLCEAFVRKALADAEGSREADEATLRRIEAVARSNRLIKVAEERLSSKPDAVLNAAVAELGLALASDDSSRIQDEADKLERILTPTPGTPVDDFFGAFFSAPQAWRERRGNAKRPQQRRAVPPPKRDLAVPVSQRELGRIFGSGSYTLDPQLCFVLMPFTEMLQPLFEDHLRPIIQKIGLRCEMADEIRGTSLITRDIWEYVNRARFPIAELTDRNPNVFYELGLAHALSKDVILLTQSMESVPFDLRAIRCLLYDFTPRGVKKLEAALSATIEALVKIG